MGAAAAAADLAFITSDNPRSEDPEAIIREVLAGDGGPGRPRCGSRPTAGVAIRGRLQAARAGDVVLILGKGHETGQEFADRIVPFDDREVAREEAQA